MELRRSYRFLAPNIVTGANIASGFLAMVAAAGSRFEVSVYLLLLAITLDTLDGTIARLLGATSKFGQEMDSFSDALSFGAAPALLIYFACLRPLGPWGLMVSLTYLLAGVFRLARFNLTTDIHKKTSRTSGVPIPIGASYLMACVLMRHQINAGIAAAVTLCFAALMATQMRLPNLKGKNVVTLMLLVGIANYFLVVFRPNWYTVGWWNVWNGCILLAARSQDRHRARLVPEDPGRPTGVEG